jgi:hypothetical protein
MRKNQIEAVRKWLSDSTLPRTAEFEELSLLTAQFIFAATYYYDRVKLHMLLHPLFYLAGFLTSYYLL